MCLLFISIHNYGVSRIITGSRQHCTDWFQLSSIPWLDWIKTVLQESLFSKFCCICFWCYSQFYYSTHTMGYLQIGRVFYRAEEWTLRTISDFFPKIGCRGQVFSNTSRQETWWSRSLELSLLSEPSENKNHEFGKKFLAREVTQKEIRISYIITADYDAAL